MKTVTRRALSVVSICTMTMVIAVVLFAAALQTGQEQVTAQEPTAQLTPGGTATNSSTPTGMPHPITLTLWWPAPLYPDVKGPAAELVNKQLKDFTAANLTNINLRIKKADGVGGVYETLYEASLVAPSATPDLTLLRRADLVQAVANKVIRPLNTDPGLFDDLFAAGLGLGQLQSTQVIQYGVPYILEVQHMVYRSSVISTAPRTLDDLLKNAIPYAFPAAGNHSVNATFLAQYLAAGGRTATKEGTPLLDRDPLVAVLNYYDQARISGLLTPGVLNNINPTQYWSTFAVGKLNAVQADSTTILAQKANLTGNIFTPLLSISGAAPSVVDGWMWVITTTSPERQVEALKLMMWLMDTNRQSDLSAAIGMLPSRRSALKGWKGDDYAAYRSFVSPLLDGDSMALLPPLDTIRPSVAAALQAAFEDVLTGRKAVNTAADDALARIGTVK